MTVRELIARLSQLNPDLPVVMAMQQEYECAVTADMVVEYVHDDGAREVRIDDCGDFA